MSSNRPTENQPTENRPTENRPQEGRPVRDWQHPAGWSLRTRLVAAMMALLALVCLVVGVTTGIGLQRALLGQKDKQLEAAMDIVREPGGPRRGGGNRPAPAVPPGLVEGTVGARLIGGQVGKAEQQDMYGGYQPLPADAAADLAAVRVGWPPRTYQVGDLGEFRVAATRVSNREVAVVGLPLADVRSVLYLVVLIEVVVTIAALVLAGWLGALIVRRNLRPLDRMAGTAGRVAELRLDRGEVALAERVPLEDTDPRTEVGQVGAALNRMLGHVAGALAARQASETQIRQFVADASHELRTPLAAIRGYAELTRRGRDTVPADLAHVLRRVESEAERMTALVEDMLLLARLDAGRPLAREPVDLVPLAVDAVSDAHATGPEHHWRLNLPEGPVTVFGDPARLHQVLANLLTNARTHTAVGTTVTVGVGTDGGDAVLRITDDGPGIPAALLPHIFERFARGDTSRSRAAGSTGLGLAIVHAVVSAHGGTVAAASAPGRKTTAGWIARRRAAILIGVTRWYSRFTRPAPLPVTRP
jgi:two-component system OmpR family sensor kinase